MSRFLNVRIKTRVLYTRSSNGFLDLLRYLTYSITGIDGVLGMISSYPKVVRYPLTTFWILSIYFISFLLGVRIDVYWPGFRMTGF